MRSVKISIIGRAIKNIVSKSTAAAVQNVNADCVRRINQPEPPKSVKKLRKF